MNTVSSHGFFWLMRSIRNTVILWASVFAVSWVLSGLDWREVMRTAVLAASTGGAFGTIEYRYVFNIAASSGRAVLAFLASCLWCLPCLWSLPDMPFPPASLWDLAWVVGVAALLCVVGLIPLRWMHGQWIRDDAD